MNANIDPRNGHVYLRRRKQVRASKGSVVIRDVEIDCEYTVSGGAPETDVDAAVLPCAELLAVSINGADCTRLLRDTRLWEEIVEKLEQSWGGL